MTKPTIATLSARMDHASQICVSMQERINALEAQVEALQAQEDKTKKQLWFLQKVAKGQIKPGTTPPVAEAQPESEVDAQEF